MLSRTRFFSAQAQAFAQALFVTFLWSTSWVLIKFGLAETPPLLFAGLRYSLAFLCLLPFALHPETRKSLAALTRREWVRLALFGLLSYGLTQGAQFVGLAYLPAITMSLVLSCTPVVVALLGLGLLGEVPALRQWGGVGLYLAGVAIYFSQQNGGESFTWVGYGVALVGLIANALSTLFGRAINRTRKLPALVVTLISMGSGAVALLLAGVTIEGTPQLTATGWSIVIWLAVVNTAFAFTLWNRTMQTLTATESSIVNNTMLIQVAVLAWIFLGAEPGIREIMGLIIAAAGIAIVQLGGLKRG